MNIGKFLAKALTDITAMANYMCGGHYEPRNAEEAQIGADLLEMSNTLKREMPGSLFLVIDTGNAAFDHDAGGSTGDELSRILVHLARQLQNSTPEQLAVESPYMLRDNNGNSVGTAHFFIKE